MSSNDIRKRRGTFSISTDLLDRAPLAVMQAMGEVIVVRCELDFMGDRFEYRAISPKFRLVPEGQYAVKYELIIHQHGPLKYAIEWQEIGREP